MLNGGALCLLIFKVVSGEEIIRLFITQQGVNFITAGITRSDTLPLQHESQRGESLPESPKTSIL